MTNISLPKNVQEATNEENGLAKKDGSKTRQQAFTPDTDTSKALSFLERNTNHSDNKILDNNQHTNTLNKTESCSLLFENDKLKSKSRPDDSKVKQTTDENTNSSNLHVESNDLEAKKRMNQKVPQILVNGLHTK